MKQPHVLVVEDEQIIALDLEVRLEGMGYAVTLETTGEGAVEAASRVNPDVMLVDIRLGGHLDGIQAAERILADADIPVVFLTAYSDLETLERAARVCPSGYIIKPFKETDLAASMHLALHRPRTFHRPANEALPFRREESPTGSLPHWKRSHRTSVVRIGDLLIDFMQHRVFGNQSAEIQLTKKEFGILQCLADHPGVPVSSEELLTKVWGSQFVHSVQALRVHLGKLRQKIEGDCSLVRIEAMRGVGYRLIEIGLARPIVPALDPIPEQTWV